MRRLVVGVIAIGAIITACAGDTGSLITSVDDLVAPFPESLRQEVLIETEEFTRVCMLEDGFQYIPHVQPTYSVSPIHSNSRAALVTESDRALVEEVGYGLTVHAVEAFEHFDLNPNRVVTEGLSQVALRTYLQTHERCALEAQQLTGFGGSGDGLVLFGLLESLEREIASDERLRPAVGQWSECMASLGYMVSSLTDPRDDFRHVLEHQLADWGSLLEGDSGETLTNRFSGELDALRRDEVQRATDDLNCRVQSGVSDALPAVVSELEQAFLARNRDLVRSISEERARVLRERSE